MPINPDKRHWKPILEVTNYVASLIAEGAKVLEIGPGDVPFPRAQTFVDRGTGPETYPCDINFQRLPFEDKSFDFIYCRHVVEDLYNPFWLCREMSRVGKAGFIETPSPMIECLRGVDGGQAPLRGYVHHRYLAGTNAGILTFLVKYPLIEKITLPDEAGLEKTAEDDPYVWNNYFTWTGSIPYRHLQHDTDYSLHLNYPNMLVRLINQSYTSTVLFKKKVLEFQKI